MNVSEMPVTQINSGLPDGESGIEVSWFQDVPMPMFRQFYDLRNLVLRICHRFGSVGSAGDYQWDEGQGGPYLAEAEIAGHDSPNFFVADEMWSAADTHIHVEPDNSKLITLELISSLVEVLSEYTEWAVGFYLEDGCVLIFSQKLLVDGARFQNSFDVASVVAACIL